MYFIRPVHTKTINLTEIIPKSNLEFILDNAEHFGKN